MVIGGNDASRSFSSSALLQRASAGREISGNAGYAYVADHYATPDPYVRIRSSGKDVPTTGNVLILLSELKSVTYQIGAGAGTRKIQVEGELLRNQKATL